MNGVSRFIAGRLARSKGESDLQSRISNRIAWISVCLSVAIMIMAISIVDGFKSELRSRISGFMGSAMFVTPGQTPLNEQYPFPDTLSYISKIFEIEGVKSVSSVAYKSGLLKTDSEIEGLFFKGVDSLYDFSLFKECIVDGNLPQFNGKISNDIMISGHTASRLGYNVGDQAIVYFIGENDVKVRKFNVAAIFEAGFEDIDSRFAVADIRQIRRLNSWGKAMVSTLEVRTEPSVSIDFVSDRLTELEYDSSSESDPALFITNIKEVYGAIFDWLKLLDLNVLMVLVLMIVVAGFNMLSAVLIILCENISTIGLLKALGMTSREVGKVFLLRSWSIVGKGIVLGNILGIALCIIQKATHLVKLEKADYFVESVPIDINIMTIVLLDLISSVLIMLLISISTRFISKISPCQSIKLQ